MVKGMTLAEICEGIVDIFKMHCDDTNQLILVSSYVNQSCIMYLKLIRE